MPPFGAYFYKYSIPASPPAGNSAGRSFSPIPPLLGLVLSSGKFIFIFIKEATFEKICANIYDIFRTVLQAGVKACQGDESKLKDFFLQRIRQIPTGWKTACDKADLHGDQVQVHIEKLKLRTAEEIEKTFLQIREEA